MWRSVGVRPALFALSLAAAGCAPTPDPWAEQPQLRVLASFAPIYCFAANVAGPDAQVRPVLTTHGPHDYTGTPGDALAFRRADLVFLNGLGLDDFSKLKTASGNSRLPMIELGKSLPEQDLREGGHCDHDHAHGHDHAHHDHAHHDHGQYDPHVWLGVPQAKHMVAACRDELKKHDPQHAAGYDARAKEYLEKLDKLHDDGKRMLAGLPERRMLTLHGALNYFGDSFGLEVLDSIQAAAGAEPTGRRLDDIIKLGVEKKVRLIAVEPQFTTKTAAQTVLDGLRRAGIDAHTVTIDPMETAADLTPDFYERKMRQNFEALAKALPAK